MHRLLAGLLLALVACGGAPDPASDVVGTWTYREDPPAQGWAELTFFADGTYEGKDARTGAHAGVPLEPSKVTVARGVWTREGRDVHTWGRTRNGEPLSATDAAVRVTLVHRGGTLRPRAADGSFGPAFRRK